MTTGLHALDWMVFIIYFFIVAGYGLWIYNRKRKVNADTKDYFLAEGSLTWWAIGASLIASNISAEQFIGMSGNGYLVGIDKNADEKKLVHTGRIAIGIAMLFAILLTWDDLLNIGGEGGLSFIQKYTGFISPGEIPLLICMRLAFAFAVAAMILVSLVGPKINPKAFELDREMFRPDARTTLLIVVTLLLLSAIYVRFW